MGLLIQDPGEEDFLVLRNISLAIHWLLVGHSLPPVTGPNRSWLFLPNETRRALHAFSGRFFLA